MKITKSKQPTREELGWPSVARHGTRTTTDEHGFSREVYFHPGHPGNTIGNPSNADYGRGSMEIKFLLHGPKASVQFVWNTGITPEKTPGRYGDEWMHHAPMGFDLGYHADKAQWSGQLNVGCTYRAKGECYYDGSSLAADEMLDIFLTRGEGAMWQELHDYYISLFEEVD